MQAVRHLLAQRRLAALICAGTLLLKLLMPTGYMIDNSHDRVIVTICSGTGPATVTMVMPEADAGMADHDKSQDHGKAGMPCAFTGLSTTSLAAVDPIQLAVLIAFVTSMGLAGPALPPPSRRTHLRPPPIGPPAAF